MAAAALCPRCESVMILYAGTMICPVCTRSLKKLVATVEFRDCDPEGARLPAVGDHVATTRLLPGPLPYLGTITHLEVVDQESGE